MAQPIRISCDSASAACSPDWLAQQAISRRCVVLQFASLGKDEKATLLRDLSAALPDHAVFSSGYLGAETITVLPVIPRSKILECQAELLQAVADYRNACSWLVARYRTGLLPTGWEADEHGDHCRFEHHRSGQVVEAPCCDDAHTVPIDPCFFHLFVETTPGLEGIAAWMPERFHDAARILDVLAPEIC